MMQKYLHQCKTILYKDLCDLRWNGQVLINIIAGIVVIILISYFPNNQFSIAFLFGFIFCMLTMIMQGYLIVEEREQKTIRRLRQADFSMNIIILSKALITFITTLFIFILFFILSGNSFLFHFKLILLSLPIIGLFLIAGTYLGLKMKNTIEVSLFATPIIVLYLFINGLLMNSSKGEMPWLAIFPNFHFHYGIVALYAKDPFLIYLIVPIIWLIGIFFLYTHWYKKQKNRFNG